MASLSLDGLEGQSIMGAMLRWQNDQGMRMRQEYTVIATDAGDATITNPKVFSDWLLTPATDASSESARDQAKRIVENVERVLDTRLAEVSNPNLHPENKQLVTGAWCVNKSA